MQPDVQHMYIYTNSIRKKRSSVWSGGAQYHMISAIGLQLSGMIYISQVKTRPHENPYFFMNSRDCHDQDSCTNGGRPVEYLPKFQLVCQTGKRVGMLEPHHQNREIAKTSGAELNEDRQGGGAG